MGMAISKKDIVKELKDFAEAASSFSSDENRMIDRFPGQWVAVIPGGQEFHGPNYESVLEQVDKDDRNRAMIRFIHPKPIVTIL